MLFIEVLPNFVISSFFLRSTLETTLVVIVSVGNPLRLFFFFGTEAEVVRARPDYWKEVNSGLIKGGH